MNVALVGLGATGKIVAEYLLGKNVLSMVLCRKNSHHADLDLGVVLNRRDTNIFIETCEHLERKLFENKPDVLIDFSSSHFLRENINLLAHYGVNIVTAVTDYEPAEIEKIKQVALQDKIGIIMAPNITHGVNVLMLLTEIATELMKGYDFQVLEEHHHRKKDSPSGTAKKIAAKIENIMINHLDDREVPIHAVRSGGIVGRHKVLICGEYDQLEISHESFSRIAFAEGAYKAANFINGKKGLYGMDNVFDAERIIKKHTVTDDDHHFIAN
ncbi:4-hydroxy-tetrahydrodipicolinate reductase [Pelosinus sp. sgz500959]|uniref:4-hydroxy-tetrahydrodipicolinate reductase n=1 Tax=Pelosinus sp. sgz500959 TaxID=3242472 RepID=UPI00366D65AE